MSNNGHKNFPIMLKWDDKYIQAFQQQFCKIEIKRKINNMIINKNSEIHDIENATKELENLIMDIAKQTLQPKKRVIK